MSKISNILAFENMNFSDKFGYIFIFVGLAIQFLVSVITGGSDLSMVSGMFGIISVVLCSQRRLMFYLFGFAQLFTYVVLCAQQRLYGEIAENVFYFVTMLFGMYHWAKHYDEEKTTVETRNLNPRQKVRTAIGTVVFMIGLYALLYITDDTQPFMDAITTVPAFVAQILMILRYKDSWYYWLTIDLGSIVMWAVAGDWCMVAQFVFWTINCLYGLRKW